MKKEIRKQEVEAVKDQDLEQVNGGNQEPYNVWRLKCEGAQDQSSNGALNLNTTTIQH